jgi:allophanate hydrolase subunit 2
MAANFSGIPPMPQQQTQNPADPTPPKLAQFPADPPVQMHLDRAQTGPYDSPSFVVPPYEIEP